MNFSLPPAKLHAAFSGKTLLGEPAPKPEVSDEMRDVAIAFAETTTRYNALKAAATTPEELAELEALTAKRAELYQRAKAGGIFDAKSEASTH